MLPLVDIEYPYSCVYSFLNDSCFLFLKSLIQYIEASMNLGKGLLGFIFTSWVPVQGNQGVLRGGDTSFKDDIQVTHGHRHLCVDRYDSVEDGICDALHAAGCFDASSAGYDAETCLILFQLYDQESDSGGRLLADETAGCPNTEYTKKKKGLCEAYCNIPTSSPAKHRIQTKFSQEFPSEPPLDCSSSGTAPTEPPTPPPTPSPYSSRNASPYAFPNSSHNSSANSTAH